MKREHTLVKRALISNSDRFQNRVVDWLARKGKIEGLLEIMDYSTYPEIKLRAQDALSKYSFK